MPTWRRSNGLSQVKAIHIFEGYPTLIKDSHLIGTLCLYCPMGESGLFEHIKLILTKHDKYKQSSEHAISTCLGLAALLVST